MVLYRHRLLGFGLEWLESGYGIAEIWSRIDPGNRISTTELAPLPGTQYPTIPNNRNRRVLCLLLSNCSKFVCSGLISADYNLIKSLIESPLFG